MVNNLKNTRIGKLLAKLFAANRKFWTWYRGLYKGTKWYTKTATVIVSLFVSFFVYLFLVDINFLWLFGKSPGYFQIKSPDTYEASEIYSADGVMIGKFFSQNRIPVKYEDVNPMFWKALIDTEDERFYKHKGIDPIGMFAVLKEVVLRHEARGASTITQQLAKNMFRVRTQYSTGLLGYIPGVRMLIMKSKEWIIATKLEFMYSKKEILTMYANTVDFGSNAYGIKTACKTYFDTTPAEITTEQIAVLVGMLKATTLYNPRTNPDNSLRRRNVVLHNMLTHNDLSHEQYDSISTLPIKLSFSVENTYDGQAQYFRAALADYLKDWCKENGYDLYTSGLKIYTTIDTRMQKYAEEAAIKQMKQVQRNFNNHWSGQEPWRDENHNIIPNFIENIAQKLPVYKMLQQRFPNSPDSIIYYLNKPHMVKLFDYEHGTIEKEMSTMDSIRYMVKFMHCSFVAMEPQTGHVKAWVGDVDFNSWKYDKVTAMRQPGSTFKLFVYTEAMNQGLTPCDKRRDEYISMQVYDKRKHEMTTWTPTNANGHFSGDSIPLKGAFAKSINSVAVRLGQEMGIKNIIKTAQDMGIKSPLDDTPSLALGASDVNLLEMVNAYCTIADDGKHVEPVLVTRIVDREGKEVYVGPTEEKQAIPYKSAFFMQQLLMGGMREPGGTSQSLWGYVGGAPDTDFGGKTGTSNNHSDAWFICVSPNIVTGAWVGGEYRSIHFRTGALGHGKFNKPTDSDITAGMYNCSSYVPVKTDTTVVDSLEHEEEIVLDENGEPVIRKNEDTGNPSEGTTTGSGDDKATTPTEKKKKSKPRIEEVRFEDL